MPGASAPADPEADEPESTAVDTPSGERSASASRAEGSAAALTSRRIDDARRADASSAPSSSFAVSLLSELVRLGVRDVVLSPGSRSQALALAAAALEQREALRLHVRIDERAAGFLALGLAMESRSPVPVITTSGTAVANLHPALLEARHAGVPLIALTADRPAELRGIRSNQTTDQVGIFGTAVVAAWNLDAPVGAPGETDAAAALARELVAASAGGPVHANLAFTEPLSSAIDADAIELDDLGLPPVDAGVSVHARSTEAPAASAAASIATVAPTLGTIVVAGHRAGPVAEAVAHALHAPLVAEIASGAHFGRNLVLAYRRLLQSAEFGGAVRRVIVFGHPTLSREVPALIAREDVETIVVRSPGVDDYNPGRRVSSFVDAVEVVDSSSEDDAAALAADVRQLRRWTAEWVHAGRELAEADAADSAVAAPDVDASRSYDRLDRARFARAELAAVRRPLTRRLVAELVWAATWPHDRLVLGASRLIRVADEVVPGKKLAVHSNRGLAGIDGTIATGIGVALAAEAAGGRGTTRVLLGDLAMLHDAGSLLFGEGERRPRVQLIVGNDGGGTIFDGLEVAASADRSAFDRVLYTPQRVDLAALAAAYGWQHTTARTYGELEQALTAPERLSIIEVPLER
ncbi:2-succinyl-5-enolpyruvyl-6-hydroxy-3-cyclohexene-1-carboxylic-acid synthase [Ruicaihuangia caeni]|uniref:2-succinyl-5-enolpyruvyl-6-hydroxy-3- cyclohexene-1-carboxylic-acid synthase n=1 Tax=Ruicaihuangia caeni TaxID=3042517 RepID=UPI0033901C21